MMDYKINNRERETLRGSPHLQQLIYFQAIRPYMDFSNGIVGIKRGISYQSIREEMYVEPHSGYKTENLSRDQIKRALQGLQRAGLIELQSERRRLIIHCKLATQDNCVQNKAALKPPQEGAAMENSNEPVNSPDSEKGDDKAARDKSAQAATPPETGNNNFIFMAFEKFWNAYPNQKGKAAAMKIFQALAPELEFFQEIMSALEKQKNAYQQKKSQGHWVPNWKYPKTWLAERCWEDKIEEINSRRIVHGANRKNHQRRITPTEILWESCKGGLEGTGFEITDEA